MSIVMCLAFLLILIVTVNITPGVVSADDKKVYIVYMGALPKSDYLPSSHHENILQQVLENSLTTESLVRSYGKSFNGFVAKLTDRERQKLEDVEGIVSVFPSKKFELHTTRSWNFIGLTENIKRDPLVESDVIVGIIDSGIWPESESFRDEGFGPPPKKWKGTCKGGQNFTCNNKVIGARVYNSFQVADENSTSARDTQGHGTHTASTVAGNQVKNASFYGIGEGMAKGAVPSARIAVYKVCSENGCMDADILAAFDDAINDGVDFLSVSMGASGVQRYDTDVISIGAFHAMQKAILTLQSAGNQGPSPLTVVSVAPWLLSVAASSIDRRIIDKVILGDGTTLVGNVVNGFDMKGKKVALIYGGDAKSDSSNLLDARNCKEGSLNITFIQGKIVYCDSFSKGKEAFNKKATGVIVEDDEKRDYSYVYPLPASSLYYEDMKRLRSYINSTRKPVASILKSEGLNDSSAPVVVSFSSRGPNRLTPYILKPDLAAPGVDILAAWSPVSSPSSVNGDTRSVMYNMLSGTSMACPHVTGVVAYVKTFHPNWSPSAIMSALMTTAFPLDTKTNPDGEFAYGAGHIDPIKAINPGLLYETHESDYINFLCNMGYDKDIIKQITGRSSSCPKELGSPKDLNYPSMASYITDTNFTRTVTNVGVANSTYTATITSPPNLEVTVSPKVLLFNSLNEKKSFVVSTLKKKGGKGIERLSASLVWSDGTHTVRSPIVLSRDS